LIATAATAATASAYRGGLAMPAYALPPVGTGAGFPRAFVFRQSEVLAQLRSYDDWASAFAMFDTIEGKLVAEERNDTVTERNIEYFSRFKQDRPDATVIWHLNGRGRLPEFETDGWWAGYWLYRAGTTLTAPVTADDTTLAVASTTVFDLEFDAFGDKWSDVVLTPADEHGAPTFATAEQIRVVAVDNVANTITVERGRYGSTAASWPAGTYAAQHLTGGPWYPGGNKIWFYNYSSVAPQDPDGRTVVDVVCDQIGASVAPDGALEFVDAIQLDAVPSRGTRPSGLDANADGKVDSGVINGINVYEKGAIAFYERLHEVIGDRLLIIDGHAGQRSTQTAINGVEFEGFPTRTDDDAALWSQGMNLLRHAARFSPEPALSYPMFKLVDWQPDQPGRFRQFRLALAASLIAGTRFTFFHEPHPGTLNIDPGAPVANRFTIWDELIAGTRQQAGWLGQPVAPPVHLGEHRPDLLARRGIDMPDDFVAAWTGPDLVATRASTGTKPIVVFSSASTSHDLTARFASIATTGDDLLVSVDMMSVAPRGYPQSVPRYVKVTASRAGGDPQTQIALAGPDWMRARFYFRGIGAGDVKVAFAFDGSRPARLRAMTARGAADVVFRRFEHGAAFTNPSLNEYRFNVANLAPGATYRRIQGSADQDPTTNNGALVGATLTVPPLDALVVANATAPATRLSVRAAL
jgi:hypothetical protein